ncbi:MAG: hypothetical protein KTV68_06455 [Acidimicrobiia bacterium]|nr:hypothetical protein [Acidimicrobiia bacterium]MCY4435023.1 hypothetical protein [bacterium]
MFTRKEQDDLAHYVYFTYNTETGEVYVGKGSGNRVWDHKRDQSFVLRHGMDEKTAELVEAAAIDLIKFLSLNPPSNRKNRDWLANSKRGDASPKKGLWNFKALPVRGPWGPPCEKAQRSSS